MSIPLAAGRKRSWIGAFAVLFLLNGQHARSESPKVELKDGDRIVLVGGTFVERDQYYGYLETILTSRLLDKNLTFRNLGWSGDTVTGISRARFGPVAEGFQHLKDHVEALKPTVLIVAYGANEAFEGEAGLPAFRDGLNTLLDTLMAATHARIVLLSPIQAEPKPAPLPDPAKHNADLKLYSEAIRDIASERSMAFIDLYNLVPMNDGSKEPMTDNGIHLTAYGYWKVGEILAKEMGAPVTQARWVVELNQNAKPLQSKGATIGDAKAIDGGMSFTLTGNFLPLPGPPNEPIGERASGPIAAVPSENLFEVKKANELRIHALPRGRHVLKVDGAKVANLPGGDPVAYLLSSADRAQIENLRALINEKNREYFYRWRPQNETYLFGFRKHEQGQNAREIPLFDPIVADLEAKIADLRKPKPHTYELIREGEVAR